MKKSASLKWINEPRWAEADAQRELASLRRFRREALAALRAFCEPADSPGDEYVQKRNAKQWYFENKER